MAAERFPVEEGHILLFARAIGDDNRIYRDRSYAETSEPGAIIAPPTFVEASAQFDPDYFLRPKIDKPWIGSGKTPTGLKASELGQTAGLLHAEQHFEYHRNLNLGDVLSASHVPGKTWEKEGRRGGKLKFSETITEYRDQNGDLVVTARSVGVVTEKPASN